MNKFIIIGTQRTGSSAFAELLGFNPMITCGWEWTKGVSWNKKIKVIEHALSGDFTLLKERHIKYIKQVHNKNKTLIGFRWLFSSSDKYIYHPKFSYTLWYERIEAFIKWVSKRPDIHILHIVRQNNLDWLKSIYLARQSNLYSQNYPDDLKVKIPIVPAIKRIRTKNWIDSRLSELKQRNPFILIHYEDFLENQMNVIDSGIKFLKCDPKKNIFSEPKQKKQSKKIISEYITNYDELKQSLLNAGLLYSSYNNQIL